MEWLVVAVICLLENSRDDEFVCDFISQIFFEEKYWEKFLEK